jgi:hypothetical protein
LSSSLTTALHWSTSSYVGTLVPGWPDGAHFLLLDDCLLWAVLWLWRKKTKIWPIFFHFLGYVHSNFGKKWVGIHFGRYFSKLIWSPYLAITSTQLYISTQCLYAHTYQRDIDTKHKFCVVQPNTIQIEAFQFLWCDQSFCRTKKPARVNWSPNRRRLAKFGLTTS